MLDHYPRSYEIRNWSPRDQPNAEKIDGDWVSLIKLRHEDHSEGLYEAFKDNSPSNWEFLSNSKPENFEAYEG